MIGVLAALAFYTAGGSAAPARETVLAAALRRRPGWDPSPLWFSNPKLNSAGFATVRSKDRDTVAFEGTAPNTPGEERRMSRSETCSPPAASIAARDPSSLPERCRAPEGTNWPSLSLHSLPNPRASTKPVGTLTRASLSRSGVDQAPDVRDGTRPPRHTADPGHRSAGNASDYAAAKGLTPVAGGTPAHRPNGGPEPAAGLPTPAGRRCCVVPGILRALFDQVREREMLLLHGPSPWVMSVGLGSADGLGSATRSAGP